jgi:hypothetical protein
MAVDLQSELEGAKGAEGQSSGAPNVSEDAVPTDDAVSAQPEPGRSDANAPTSGSTDDQEPTTD